MGERVHGDDDGRVDEFTGRRRVLATAMAAAGTATLAGCSALWDQTGATDVVVHNVASEPTVVSVTITPQPGSPTRRGPSGSIRPGR